MEFQEALRRDREAAAAVAPTIPTGDARSSGLDGRMPSVSSVPASRFTPAADADTTTTTDVDAGLTIGGEGGAQEGAVVVVPRPDQTAEERRAMIAESYARLGLGS